MTMLAERVGKLELEFRVGVLAWAMVQDVVNYGRVLGLNVDVHYSGWLNRHGWIVARGGESAIRTLADYIVQTGKLNTQTREDH
jgi:hypothetical protein